MTYPSNALQARIDEAFILYTKYRNTELGFKWRSAFIELQEKHRQIVNREMFTDFLKSVRPADNIPSDAEFAQAQRDRVYLWGNA